MKYQIIDNMANFQPFISTKSAQKSLCSCVRELEGVHARIPQLVMLCYILLIEFVRLRKELSINYNLDGKGSMGDDGDRE